jgi:hypothetical protein
MVQGPFFSLKTFFIGQAVETFLEKSDYFPLRITTLKLAFWPIPSFSHYKEIRIECEKKVIFHVVGNH